MPFVYNISSKEVAENYETSGSTNTQIDAAFVKPGSTRAVAIIAARVQGKGAGLTALSGIAIRLSQWTSTSSSSGTSITPRPVDNRVAAAAVATAAAGAGGSTGAVTSGTGGPSVVCAFGCGASGPGGWVAPNPDAGLTLDGGANKSTDLFSASGQSSLKYEFSLDVQE